MCSLLAEASFGDRLKAFRTAAGLSQFGFSLQVGARADQVGRWEKGKDRPAQHELELLAEALGLTVQALTGTAESPKGD